MFQMRLLWKIFEGCPTILRVTLSESSENIWGSTALQAILLWTKVCQKPVMKPVITFGGNQNLNSFPLRTSYSNKLTNWSPPKDGTFCLKKWSKFSLASEFPYTGTQCRRVTSVVQIWWISSRKGSPKVLPSAISRFPKGSTFSPVNHSFRSKILGELGVGNTLKQAQKLWFRFFSDNYFQSKTRD